MLARYSNSWKWFNALIAVLGIYVLVVRLPPPLDTIFAFVVVGTSLINYFAYGWKKPGVFWQMFKREHQEYLADRDRYLQRPPRSRPNQLEGVAQLQRGAEAEH